jgi:hypothetical protein
VSAPEGAHKEGARVSDFFNSGWSIFVAAVTIIGLIACLALLIIAARGASMANDNTTGHVWDEDLRELNNPLPRWWMWPVRDHGGVRRDLPGAVPGPGQPRRAR